MRIDHFAFVATLVAAVSQPLCADVYVSAERGDDIAGTGSYEQPYRTIQKGVDEVEAGGTVKILRGTYGIGEEHFGNNHTNRVVIGKSITLEGVDGKDVTHIVGRFDPDTKHGNGPAAIRCIAITNEAAAGTIITNLTLCNGAANTNNTLNGYGGAIAYCKDQRSTVCMVDCVISNCVAVMGGGPQGVTAVRCLIADCRTTGFGVAARYSNLLNCLVAKNRCLGGNGARPVLADGVVAVNCTVTRNLTTLTFGLGRDCCAYNCVVFDTGGSREIVTDIANQNVTETNNCYTTATDAHLLFSPASGDFRLTAGTDAVGGGATSYLSTSWLTSKSIRLPAGVAANIDFAGNTIDLEQETCHPGCIQGTATPGGGRVEFNYSTGWVVNGYVNEYASSGYLYYTPESWPISVTARPLVANVTNYVYSETVNGYFGHNWNRRYYPLRDGSHVITPPPNATDTLRLIPRMADKVVYASPEADPATADGSLEHPFATLQDAVVCVTNSSASIPLILALPGVYDQGGEEIGGVFTRLVLPDAKHFTVRSTDGAERTVIKGHADESNTGHYAGCGPAAVRCIHISRGVSTVTPSAVQGFTIADGHTHCDDYRTDTDPYRGGGILASAKNRWVSQVLDCVFTNCAAVRCGVSFNVMLLRCRLYDCHGYGGVTRATHLVSCYIDPSCTLGSAPSDAPMNGVVGSSSATHFVTAPGTDIRDDGNITLYNSLFTSLYPGNAPVMWGSVTTNAAAIASIKGCAYVRNANFADPAGGDWRLRATTPARAAVQLPEKDSTAYSSWAAELAYTFHGDIDGKPLSVIDGKPLPGCWQTPAGGKSVFVDAASGGLSISDGVNFEAADMPLAVAVGAGSRPCIGCVANGVTNLFADTPTVTVTAEALAASDCGIFLAALYSNDLYVNPADGVGDDLNNGFSPSTPKKTLAAALELAIAGDTVHAAPGDYSEGIMRNSAVGAEALASRAVVPPNVTLVSDGGADVTFITGADATAEDADQFGRGSDAVRCVFLYTGATLKGFTLRGGRTRSGSFDTHVNDADYLGGGAYSPAWTISPVKVAETRVEDCVVSNCISIVGGAGLGVTFDRCRLFRCRAVRGSAVERVGLVNTIVDDMDSEGSSGIGVANWYSCVNSTLGANFRRDSTGRADGYAMHNQWKAFYGISNSVVRGKAAITNAVNCVFSSTDGSVDLEREDMINCLKLTAAECALDEAYRPDLATSALVDAGCAIDVGGTDVYGGQRVYNGKIDIGAVEADWRPAYAKLLDGRGSRIQVGEAAPGVTTNGVDGAAAVELHGGEAVSMAWSRPRGAAPRRGKVLVTGAGTLSMTHGGEAYATFTATGGAAEFEVPAAWLDTFTFAFEGEGAAELYGFSSPIGATISFR